MPFCAPQIVFSQSWLNIVSAISVETIFTSQVAGVYRISVLFQHPKTASPQISQIDALIACTNLVGLPESAGAGGVANYNLATFASEQWLVSVAAGAPFSFSLAPSEESGGFVMDANVFVIIEQLA